MAPLYDRCGSNPPPCRVHEFWLYVNLLHQVDISNVTYS